MDLATLCALMLVALMPLLYFAGSRRGRRRDGDRLPPGPFNLPVIGSLHRLGSLPHISLQKLSRKHGDVMHPKLGRVSAVIISSARAASEIFKLHSLQCSSKPSLICSKYFGNDSSGIIFSSYTPQVKLYRKLINTHLLSPARLRICDGIRRAASLDPSATSREIRCSCAKTYRLFGERSFCGSSQEFVRAIVETIRLVGIFNVSDYIPWLRWLDVQGLEKQYKQLTDKLNRHLFSILRDRRENPRVVTTDEEPMAFIDVLISMDELSDTTKITLLLITQDILLGAVDSSALSVEWAMAELLRHPAELSRARREIDDVVGSQRLVEDSDLPKLRYVEAIAKETLRLHQVTPLINPKLVEGGPIKLGGFTIPAGALVYLSSYAIGMDEKFWKEPLEFRPQRFIEQDIDVFGQNFHFVPFGTGRRVCPGAKLGLDTVRIGVATLVQGFDWELDQDPAKLDMAETFGLVCQKTQPLVAIPRPRLDSHVY
ncbi:hypothetical protein SELMODRAFT_268606 [Selaginella moellendorffii]|uniref:Cytochrome P450-dependent monooxygenase n=1 Tax=Selaginella moellendorffii TaxID=88036 RepID=D8SH12_SELML|nr:hypothetical protein SELMODRAFT_268606 [Selaginella moellendorffii]